MTAFRSKIKPANAGQPSLCALSRQDACAISGFAVIEKGASTFYQDAASGGAKTMRYDPGRELGVKAWLDRDEDGRIALALDYRQRTRAKAPNLRMHAAIHAIVENQVAPGGDYPVAATLERLMGEGLDRHEAVHAIGSVLAGQIFEALQGRAGGDLSEPYVRDLAKLTAKKWRSGGR
jgi:hypothetical protein